MSADRTLYRLAKPEPAHPEPASRQHRIVKEEQMVTYDAKQSRDIADRARALGDKHQMLVVDKSAWDRQIQDISLTIAAKAQEDIDASLRKVASLQKKLDAAEDKVLLLEGMLQSLQPKVSKPLVPQVMRPSITKTDVSPATPPLDVVHFLCRLLQLLLVLAILYAGFKLGCWWTRSAAPYDGLYLGKNAHSDALRKY